LYGGVTSGLVAILDDMGIDGMSEEESDNDGYGMKTLVSDPAWRSLSLSAFLHGLDASTRSTSRHLIKKSRDTNSIVPSGLPINCYDSEWISSFSGIRTLKRDMKGAIIMPSIAIN
jgi:hypothetical protein